MEWLGILTVIGVVLGFLALPWLQKPINKFVSRIRVRGRVLTARIRGLPSALSGAEAIRKGTSTDYLTDFMLCDWTHEIFVAAEGTARTTIDLTLVNLTNESALEIGFPVYVDYEEFYEFNRPSLLPFWAKVGRATYDIFPQTWDPARSLGLVRIPFPMPLKPREDIRIRWGYSVPRLYGHEGHHWFEWYMARPHSIFRLSLKFDDPWRVKNVAVTALGASQKPQNPRVSDRLLRKMAYQGTGSSVKVSS